MAAQGAGPGGIGHGSSAAALIDRKKVTVTYFVLAIPVIMTYF